MRSTIRAKRSIVVLLAGAVVALTGCQHVVNPFDDQLAGLPEATTASATGARSAPTKETLGPRGFEPMAVESQDGTVAHWPLWWEDPFEDKGSDDDRFAWTAEDYFAIPYGAGRFLLNTMAFPISASVTPPFTVMCSDGRLSRQALAYDHDATPCPAGTAPPIDILEMGAEGAAPAPEDDSAAE